MQNEIPVQVYLADLVTQAYGDDAAAVALKVVHQILGHAGGVELATGTFPWLLEQAKVVPERNYAQEHGLPIPYDLLATPEQRSRIQEALISLSPNKR